MQTKAFQVYLSGKLIDTIFYDVDSTADAVRDSLVKHDGYDGNIRVIDTAPALTRPDFRLREFWYRDPWRGGIYRHCQTKGQCVACGRKTFGFDDGEDDPRGVLGDHAESSLTASEFGKVGPDVPMCVPCANEEGRYNVGVKLALKRWKDAVKVF